MTIHANDPLYDQLLRQYVADRYPAFVSLRGRRFQVITDNQILYFVEVDALNVDSH